MYLLSALLTSRLWEGRWHEAGNKAERTHADASCVKTIQTPTDGSEVNVSEKYRRVSVLDNFKAIHLGIGVAKSSEQKCEQKRVGTNRNALQRKQKEEELIRTRGSKEYVGRFTGTGAEAFRVIVVGAPGDHRR